MSMLVAHEAPIAVMDLVQRHTDYDYCLVHLLEKSGGYYEFFRKSLRSGRTVYMDVSTFELQKPFNDEQFAHWIEKLQPQYYVVPDALESLSETINYFEHWVSTYNVPGKKIGVVQGKTYKELIDCYNYMADKADMIAISFDYSWYEQVFPQPNKYISWALGRVYLLGKLLDNGVINTLKPHHLLGCSCPREFSFYHENYPWLTSLDTSSPVVCGILGRRYDEFGIWKKEAIKLADMIKTNVTEKMQVDILYNINRFREMLF